MKCTYCGVTEKLHRHGTTDPGFSRDITEQPKPIYACQSCDPIFPRTCVIYRSGGTENFQWHKIKRNTEADAERTKNEIIVAGRPAMTATEHDPLPDCYGQDVLLWSIHRAREALAR